MIYLTHHLHLENMCHIILHHMKLGVNGHGKICVMLYTWKTKENKQTAEALTSLTIGRIFWTCISFLSLIWLMFAINKFSTAVCPCFYEMNLADITCTWKKGFLVHLYCPSMRSIGEDKSFHTQMNVHSLCQSIHASQLGGGHHFLIGVCKNRFLFIEIIVQPGDVAFPSSVWKNL